jgi:zinc protease
MQTAHRETLENGLTVVVQELRDAPVVAVQAWVGVGSADEDAREAGLAHLHEHMLFKGTTRRRVGEIAQAIEGAGGEINAWTSFDQTVYHVVLASRFFDVGVDVLADAIQHSAFDAAELAREKEVVLEEIKRGEDQPSRVVTQELFRLAYTQHPYRNPIIGTRETVASFTRDDVLAFFRKWYVPSNVTVIVAGDVALAHALDVVRRAFGGFEPRALPRRHGIVEPRQNAPRAEVRREPIEESYFNFAVHVPAIDHEDVPALDLIAAVLGQGESTRLVQRIKRRKALVNEIYAYAYTPSSPGLLTVGGSHPPRKLRRALGETVSETFRITRTGVTEAELGKARAVLESQAVYDRETAQGLARKIGFYESVFHDPGAEQRYYDALAKATPERLVEVARRYLDPERMTIVAVLPEKAAGAASIDESELRALTVDAGRKAMTSRAPAAAADSAARSTRPRRHALQPERTVLPTGGVLLALRDARVPLVAMRAVWPGGLRLEASAENGVSNFVAELLTQGTVRRSAEAVAHAIDEMAGSLGGFTGRNSFGARAEMLSRHFERGLDLTLECLLEPAFRAEEVERQRDLILEDIRVQNDNPSGVAFRSFAQALYPRHPYRLPPSGTARTVQALTRAKLRRYYERSYDPGRAIYAVVGDIDPERVLERLVSRLGPKRKLARPPPSPRPDAALSGPVLREEVLEKRQAHVVIGFRGATVRSKDRYALEVLSTILSGQGGRLFVELRDRRSLAYSVASFSVEGLEPGYFAVYIGTSPEKIEEAVSGIFGELAKIRDSLVSSAELGRAKRYLIGSHAISLQRMTARAASLAFDECYGLGIEESDRYAERISAVTRETLRDVAARYIDFHRYALSLVRPANATPVAALQAATGRPNRR